MQKWPFLEYHIQLTEGVFFARPIGQSGADSPAGPNISAMVKERRMLSARGATIITLDPDSSTETLRKCLSEVKRGSMTGQSGSRYRSQSNRRAG